MLDLSTVTPSVAGPRRPQDRVELKNVKSSFRRTLADVFKKDLIGKLYKLDPSDVEVYYFEPSLAVKISIPRELPCGTPGDRDMLGGQQFTPLLTIPVELGTG